MHISKLGLILMIFLFSNLTLYVPTVEAKIVTDPDELHDQIFVYEQLSVDGDIYVHPTSKNLYFHNDTALYTSSDNGSTWSFVRNTIAGFKSMYFTDGGILLVNNGVGGSGKILRSTDNGVTFTAVMNLNGSSAWMNTWSWTSYNDTMIFTGEYDSGVYSVPKYVYRSTDAGETWKTVLNVTETFAALLGDHGSWRGHIHKVAVDRYDKRVWVSLGDFQGNRTMFYSDDWGETWNTFGRGHTIIYEIPERPLSIIPLEDRVIFGDDSTAYAGFVYMKKSNTWYSTFHRNVHHFWVMAEHNGVIYAGTHHNEGVSTEDGIWVTLDGWNWYHLLDTTSSGGVFWISERNDEEYFYFYVNGDIGTCRAKLLTKEEVAYLLRDNMTRSKVDLFQTGTLVDGNDGYDTIQSLSLSSAPTYTLTVTGVNRTNLLSNSGFEKNTDTNILPDSWILDPGNNVTWQWTDADPFDGKYLVYYHNQSDKNIVKLKLPPVDNINENLNYLFSVHYKFNGTELSNDSSDGTGIQIAWEPTGGGALKKSSYLRTRAPTLHWKRTYLYTKPPIGGGRAEVSITICRDQAAFYLDDFLLESSSMVQSYFPYIPSGTYMSENVNITITNGVGQSETFNVGTINNGKDRVLSGTIPAVGRMKFKTDIDGSKVVNYTIAITPISTVSNCILTGMKNNVYYGIAYDDLMPSVTTSYDNLFIFLKKPASLSSVTCSNSVLAATIDSPLESSTSRIYCGDWGKPTKVEGVSEWTYDGDAKILTIKSFHSSSKIKVYYNLPPTANFEHSSNSPTVGHDINFMDLSTDPEGQIASWLWDFGDGYVSIKEKPIHKFEKAGSYTVTLTVSDDGGLEATHSEIIDVKADIMLYISGILMVATILYLVISYLIVIRKSVSSNV